MDISEIEKQKIYYRLATKVNFDLATDAVDPKDVTYKLFTKENPSNEVVVSEENIESLNLDKEIKTILMIHGWTSSDLSPWYPPLKDAFLQYGSYNIISISWHPHANYDYKVSCAYVKPVGELIARFLGKLGLKSENIHLIAHSLGAYVAAYTSKAYEKEFGKKIGRITALDPAGPRWSNKDVKKEERLSELDARFVDVIHTDIQLFGYTNPIGHVDYYPNGGTDQPGCPDKEQNANCNHQRSVWFFIESINKRVKASEINFEEDEEYKIIITPKENPKEIIFGEHADLESRGVYFLKTNPSKPFLI